MSNMSGISKCSIPVHRMLMFIYCRYKCGIVDKTNHGQKESVSVSCILLTPTNSGNHEEAFFAGDGFITWKQHKKYCSLFLFYAFHLVLHS
jgi:hypothetical protein